MLRPPPLCWFGPHPSLKKHAHNHPNDPNVTQVKRVTPETVLVVHPIQPPRHHWTASTSLKTPEPMASRLWSCCVVECTGSFHFMLWEEDANFPLNRPSLREWNGNVDQILDPITCIGSKELVRWISLQTKPLLMVPSHAAEFISQLQTLTTRAAPRQCLLQPVMTCCRTTVSHVNLDKPVEEKLIKCLMPVIHFLSVYLKPSQSLTQSNSICQVCKHPERLLWVERLVQYLCLFCDGVWW